MKTRVKVYFNEDYSIITVSEIPLEYSTGYSTDEGFHNETHIWYIEDNTVIWEIEEHGQDCDGPLFRSCVLVCPLNEIKAETVTTGIWDTEGKFIPTESINNLPRWNKISSGQRDIYAESMGY
jgi:hypothetical protein